ncbi:molybdopterin-dependent oxidoreductase, partial [Campylobacter concisus]|uniref:molybdopterin-dependent oxidoreductase n=1 Tax=Campylobacter concisus TaxID=199 RepID=UPI0015E19CFA
MIGSNPENGHSLAAMHIQRSLNRGAKLIVIDPIKTEFASRADIHLQLEPEHNIPAINALLYTIIEEGLVNEETVRDNTIGIAYVKEAVKEYAPEVVAKSTRQNQEDIRAAPSMN